ncbi:MAG: DUF192 domain-containing protein [Deltaproteobacteria bacterium]|jgi:uncharacterized protein|nr:DUF192 domain-containing protein [Deltaproteobacteria bacterium]MBT4089143.1 DUF192 domain-containing protein [Deltaproteobacteria bacterium]MBT4267098.1 DUF192 domain-containing protein [Deltaproteobacteria bacterium]MBT4641010.1 DUF192 domain-containing protein [Deltaproteobacteria bacterium]MBT6499749.1 DUF192 domain-containing protein [Deltaproteobacteria bacterium]
MAGKIIFFLCIFFLISDSGPASGWKKLLIHDRHLIRVEYATTSREQIQGLGGRKNFPDGTGMLFIYKSPGERIFWMKRMRIPIDILWIHRGQIVSIEHQVPPPSTLMQDNYLKRYGHGIAADMVLELPAGYVRRHSIQVGHSIQLIP